MFYNYLDLTNNCYFVDGKISIQIILLGYMIPSAARIKQADKKIWKPTVAESIDSVIVHAKVNLFAYY